jgi:hypothetical protein
MSETYTYVIELNTALPHAWKIDPPQIVESPYLSSVNYGTCFTSNLGSAMKFDDLEKTIKFITEHQHIKEFVDAIIWKRYLGLEEAQLIKCIPYFC